MSRDVGGGRLEVVVLCGPELLRLGVERLLRRDPSVRVRSHRPRAGRGPADVAVVCDRDLRDVPGACAAAAERFGAPVVMVASRPDPAVALDCLAAGATGLVLEGDSGAELRAATLAAAGGEYHVGPRMLTLLLDWQAGRRGRAAETGERSLLALLAGGHTTGEIAAALGVAPKTVRNRSSLLYRRLGVRSRAEAVRVAEARGLLDG